MRTVHEKSDVVPLIAEVFRELGYEGAALSHLTGRTGLSKGSLYHFFPEGKEEMARAVLDHVKAWFETEMFTPLSALEPAAGIARMLAATRDYFHSGRRICLLGAFALDETRDHFAPAIRGYFTRWIFCLEDALTRGGLEAGAALELAEDSVAGIQGALVLARALDEPEVFLRRLDAIGQRLELAVLYPPIGIPPRRIPWGDI